MPVESTQYPDSTHRAQYQYPEQFVQHIERFLEGLSTGAKRIGAWRVHGEFVTTGQQRRKRMSKTLKDKIALITGGTEGIGLATAKLFVKEGAYVFITGRRQKELDDAVEALGSNVSGAQGDISKLTDLDRLYKTVSDVKARIDVVFANAGVGEFVPFGAVTEEHFEKLFNINVRGTLFTVQKALPLM